jgi:cell division protein FtsL
VAAASIAHEAGSRRRARSGAGPKALGGGLLWIVVFAALLAGVVAVNVAVLELNVKRDRLGRERVQLQADVARLRSQLSSAAATATIQGEARKDLGLVEADPDRTIYVRIDK